MKRFFLGTAWSQDVDDPVGLRGARGLGRGSSLLDEVGDKPTHSPQPHCLLLLSSGITLHVVFHFIPEVLLWSKRDQREKEEGRAKLARETQNRTSGTRPSQEATELSRA